MAGASAPAQPYSKENKMAGAFPHKDGETVYYVRQYGYTFPVKKLDPATNRPIQKTNPATGQPLFLPNGDPDIVEIFYDFKRWRTKFCADGYVCVYIIDAKTDPRVKAEIERMAADRTEQVMTEKVFIRSVNPELADQIEKDEKQVQDVANLTDKNKALAAEVEALKKKLGGNRS
jgi:hypothetical protein